MDLNNKDQSFLVDEWIDMDWHGLTDQPLAGDSTFRRQEPAENEGPKTCALGDGVWDDFSKWNDWYTHTHRVFWGFAKSFFLIKRFIQRRLRDDLFLPVADLNALVRSNAMLTI